MEGIIRLLAHSHFMCIKQLEEDRFLAIDSNSGIENFPFKKYDDLHRLIYEKLGFEYRTEDFAPKFDLINSDSLLEFTFKNTVSENKIAKKVKEYYGDNLFFLYMSVIYLCNIYAIASTATYMLETLKDKNVAKIRRSRALKFKKYAIKSFNEIKWILKEKDVLSKFYEPSLVEKIDECNTLIQEKGLSLDSLEELHNKMRRFISEITPEFIRVFDNQLNAFSLIEELKCIKPGFQHWSKYEKYCIKVLNYLFIPEFRKVYSQVKALNGTERRDAILPNNSSSRFWNDIKNEFQSKNIIFEFKNLSKESSKEELNQLRIYLSKPTIGKFGFLFVRNSAAKKALVEAQRNAYEQNGILILIIDDNLIKKLILSKAYFGTCEDIIANEKIKFELNY